MNRMKEVRGEKRAGNKGTKGIKAINEGGEG
jgi:hypothetical protein